MSMAKQSESLPAFHAQRPSAPAGSRTRHPGGSRTPGVPPSVRERRGVAMWMPVRFWGTSTTVPVVLGLAVRKMTERAPRESRSQSAKARPSRMDDSDCSSCRGGPPPSTSSSAAYQTWAPRVATYSSAHRTANCADPSESRGATEQRMGSTTGARGRDASPSSITTGLDALHPAASNSASTIRVTWAVIRIPCRPSDGERSPAPAGAADGHDQEHRLERTRRRGHRHPCPARREDEDAGQPPGGRGQRRQRLLRSRHGEETGGRHHRRPVHCALPLRPGRSRHLGGPGQRPGDHHPEAGAADHPASAQQLPRHRHGLGAHAAYQVQAPRAPARRLAQLSHPHPQPLDPESGVHPIASARPGLAAHAGTIHGAGPVRRSRRRQRQLSWGSHGPVERHQVDDFQSWRRRGGRRRLGHRPERHRLRRHRSHPPLRAGRRHRARAGPERACLGQGHPGPGQWGAHHVAGELRANVDGRRPQPPLPPQRLPGHREGGLRAPGEEDCQALEAFARHAPVRPRTDELLHGLGPLPGARRHAPESDAASQPDAHLRLGRGRPLPTALRGDGRARDHRGAARPPGGTSHPCGGRPCRDEPSEQAVRVAAALRCRLGRQRPSQGILPRVEQPRGRRALPGFGTPRSAWPRARCPGPGASTMEGARGPTSFALSAATSTSCSGWRSTPGERPSDRPGWGRTDRSSSSCSVGRETAAPAERLPRR